MALNKNFHEAFTKFFEEPTRDKFRELLKNNVGELDNLDFKQCLPVKDKLAKHLLAMANSNGGAIIIGVSDDSPMIATGIETLVDKASIQNKLAPYLPKSLKYEVLDFAYKDAEFADLKGKSFQVFIIEGDNKKIPFLSLKASNNVKSNVAYIRRGTSSEEASYEDLQKIINRRIETGYSSSNLLSLNQHIEQLKALYDSIPRHYNVTYEQFYNEMEEAEKSYSNGENPSYPEEEFDEFLSNLIYEKKRKIKEFLEIQI
jgi:predicted HTH transcriptional regulator